MNRLARWTMLLYPSRWRRRYGDEVEALIDDAGADARMVADLLKTAMHMQFSTWSFPRLAAVLGLAGTLTGLAISFLTPVQYLARTQLHVTDTDSAVQTTEMLSSMVASRQFLTIVINDPKLDLYREERRIAPLADVIEQMRRDLVVRPDGPRAFAIQFTYRDKAKAQATVQSLAESAAEQLPVSAALYRNQVDPNAIEVVDPASLPTVPLRPDLLPMAGGGLAAGLLLAILWHLKSRRRRYLSLSFAGAAAGIALAYLIPSIAGIFPDDFPLLRYESRATMYTERGDAVPDLAIEAGSRSAMAVLISGDATQVLHRDLAITTRGDGGNGRFIDISFTYFDRLKCQQTVNAVINRITESNRRAVGHTIPLPPRQTQWGRIVPGSKARIDVETVTPDRASATITGLLAGLALAAIVAMLRRRWQPSEEDEAPVPCNSGALKFNRARFRKLAIWLVAAGASCGAIAAILAPTRYVSDALVSFDIATPDRVASLIDGVVNRGTDSASWQNVESAGAKTNAFRIQCVANDSVRARSAVQDALGDIDRAITNLHSGDEMRMNVIDPPLLPSHAEGIGWWAVAIGTLSGLALAFLFSLIDGFGNWQKKEWGHRQVTPLR